MTILLSGVKTEECACKLMLLCLFHLASLVVRICGVEACVMLWGCYVFDYSVL